MKVATFLNLFLILCLIIILTYLVQGLSQPYGKLKLVFENIIFLGFFLLFVMQIFFALYESAMELSQEVPRELNFNFT